MKKEQVTDKEAFCMLFIFTLGSTAIIGIGAGSKNDGWIAGIIGLIMALPVILAYSRIVSLFPGKDIFEILCTSLGNFLGRVVSILYIWYAFHLGALVIRNFGEFINTVTMPETPIFVPMLALGLVCIALVKSGVEVIGRISVYFIFPMLFIILMVQVLVIPNLHLDYIKPVLSQGLYPLFKYGFSVFSFPFAETILFIGVFFSLQKRNSSYKVYFSGVIFGGIVIILLTIRNILVLGELREGINFSSYVAVSRISIGDFLQRIEITVAFVFVVSVFIKAGICLFVACKGISKFFRLNDYRSIVMQTGLLMIYFSYIVYDDIMEMNYWAFKVYAYYAFPFQVVIPLIVLIVAEIRMRLCKGANVSSS